MPKIKFTATPELPRDIAHLGYKKDDVVDMLDASCRRWIRRGVAEYYVEKAFEMPRMEPVDRAAFIDELIADNGGDPIAIERVTEVEQTEAGTLEVVSVAETMSDGTVETKRRGRKPHVALIERNPAPLTKVMAPVFPEERNRDF